MASAAAPTGCCCSDAQVQYRSGYNVYALTKLNEGAHTLAKTWTGAVHATPDCGCHRRAAHMTTFVPPGFVPAPAFEGARPGLVFKRGTAGNGYYPDIPPTPVPSNKDGVVTLAQGTWQTCHYDLLGVPRDAPYEQIKTAYRRKALECHPDRNADDADSATQRFQAVQAAFAVLGDVLERRWYDMHREAILSGGLEQSGPAARAWSTMTEEEPETDLMPFFSPAAFSGFNDEGPGGGGDGVDSAAAHVTEDGCDSASPAHGRRYRDFFAVYGGVFAALAAEEAALKPNSKRAETAASDHGSKSAAAGAKPAPFGAADSPAEVTRGSRRTRQPHRPQPLTCWIAHHLPTAGGGSFLLPLGELLHAPAVRFRRPVGARGSHLPVLTRRRRTPMHPCAAHVIPPRLLHAWLARLP